MDLTNKRYTRWLVLSRAGLSKSAKQLWNCLCDCGNTSIVCTGDLNQGKSKSCGCLDRELTRNRIIHGHSRAGAWSPTYNTWNNLYQRCFVPSNPNYRYYGAKGVIVCDRWNPKAGGSFQNFLADMGERPKGKTIDRFPNQTGNYEPSNCRWATPAEQAQNQSSTKLTPAKVLEIRARKAKGESARALAVSYGVWPSTIHRIVNREYWENIV